MRYFAALVVLWIAFVAFLFWFWSSTAHAQAISGGDFSPSDLKFIKNAYHSKEWSLLVSGVLMLIVRGATLLKPLAAKLPDQAAKWLAVGLAMVGAMATAIITGDGWVFGLISGILAGLTAVGMWETAGKHMPGLRPKPAPSDIASPPNEGPAP